MTMQYINISRLMTALAAALLFAALWSCENMEDDGLPITNDLRVLQVKSGNTVLTSGLTGVSVLADFELVFSHGLNTSAFEAALSISPTVAYTLSYDETASFVTLSFDEPLDYERAYTIALPQGTYGRGGEASTEDFSFAFTTAAFNAPPVTLSSSELSFFEGETITITATIPGPILETVSMDLVFDGTAEGEGIDYEVSSGSIVIPAGETSASVELTGLDDAETEGEETIIITLDNLVNGVESMPQRLDLTLGDTPPAIAFKGIMSLKIGGTSNNGRAVHLRVLEDIADLSEYGIGIANNGGGTDGREIDFPAISVVAGDDVLLVRDIDEAGLAAYFEDCYNDFEHVVPSGGVNFNGDDAVELFKGNTVIETFGDPDLIGTDQEWEYAGTWAYKLKGIWEYGQLDCSANSTTTSSSPCVYPFCQALQLQGVLAILWDGSGTNGGKAVHLRANRAIPDLSRYGVGVANNGGGTDGIEVTFSAVSLEEGDHVLIAREPATLASYFGNCFDRYDYVVQDDAMNQNGDDAIELFDGMDVIETFGDINVDGTGQFWDYEGSWAYKVGSQWAYGGVDCAAGSSSTQSSACPYLFCN